MSALQRREPTPSRCIQSPCGAESATPARLLLLRPPRRPGATMGAGASAAPGSAVPATKEEALAAGFSEEQVDAFMTDLEAYVLAAPPAPAPAPPPSPPPPSPARQPPPSTMDHGRIIDHPYHSHDAAQHLLHTSRHTPPSTTPHHTSLATHQPPNYHPRALAGTR